MNTVQKNVVKTPNVLRGGRRYKMSYLLSRLVRGEMTRLSVALEEIFISHLEKGAVLFTKAWDKMIT